MTTDRPYRKRLGLDIVIAELQKCKGTQFDPEIVDAVISSVALDA
jgi:HD-GYP domain-containing protein (c-di-GMP phosphodiesterase class II)